MRKLPVMMIFWLIALMAAAKDFEVQNQPYYSSQWVKVTRGNIPASAFRAGKEANGFTLYIARVLHKGSLLTGKTGQGWTCGYFPYGGREIRLEGYEVYTGSGRWHRVFNGGTVPAHAIQAGYEANGEPLYIARAQIEGGIHIGKARAGAAFIPYGDEERVLHNFEVLVGSSVRASADSPVGRNQTATIRLEDINEWLCPNNLTRGDREFDGHGPRIKSEVRLRIGDGGTALYADITFWAQETVHDWSTAEGRWTRKVYDAPYGKKSGGSYQTRLPVHSLSARLPVRSFSFRGMM